MTQGPPSDRLPFNVVDEAVHLLDTDAEPWSIQLELRVTGSLDEARFRAAVGEAISRHPMARARKVKARLTERRWSWEFPDVADLDPVRAVDCPDDEALERAREDVYALSVPLAESPPLRVRLAHHPRGDVVMLNVPHAAIDGFGGLRVLTSIARAYAGEPDPLPDLDLREAHDLTAALTGTDRGTRARRLATVAEKLRDALSPPGRMAPEGGQERAGYGFHHVRLTTEQTSAVAEIDHPGTVNDVLLAALHLAVDAWNAEHGVPARRVSVLMPVNLRPKEWWDEMVGNRTLMVRVATTPADRAAPEAVLRAITAQSERIKGAGTAAALVEVLKKLPGVPLWVKQAIAPVVAVTGNRLVDTVLLSNLGQLAALPSFGPDAGDSVELWFSAPARMPLGLSLGTTTVAGRLHLSFRYRHPLLGPDAARRFAERYVEMLEGLVAKGQRGELAGEEGDAGRD